ncbi:MAG TPA: hypothetical protein VER03_05360, partial [Bryobacteraceae bacterium]|nr:hypothetical protein [Bryobacteraceae bacterium]
MKECPSLEALAMWVDEGEAAGVSASHIAECSACGEFVAELKADQALLRSSTELPEFAHAAVRGRVLG